MDQLLLVNHSEFDYSGSHLTRSLREEGIEVSLINSNPATIMTDKVVADNVYLKPLEVQSLIDILEERHIDALYYLPWVVKTTLNLCIGLDEKGVWKKYGVEIIGVDIGIHITEDRERFRELMGEIDIPVAPSELTPRFLEGKAIAQELGFPLVIRPFTLGGSGFFVHNKEDFEDLLSKGLHFLQYMRY